MHSFSSSREHLQLQTAHSQLLPFTAEETGLLLTIKDSWLFSNLYKKRESKGLRS